MYLINENKIEAKYGTLLFLASVPAGIFKISNIQRGMFLITNTIPELFENPYVFEASSYGPRSELLYKELKELKLEKLIYSFDLDTLATRDGIKYTSKMEISDKHFKYVKKVAEWIVDMPFITLCQTFRYYYPHMARLEAR
jgi:hypothetical protein